MSGGRFLLQRWEVPISEAPDGLSVIGFNARRGTPRQHCFDSRGGARPYVMGLADRVWTLERAEADLSPLDFDQRLPPGAWNCPAQLARAPQARCALPACGSTLVGVRLAVRHG